MSAARLLFDVQPGLQPAVLVACVQCGKPGDHYRPAFRGAESFFTCEAYAQPQPGWRSIEPCRGSTTCSWCAGGYLRLTDGQQVLHELPEPAGMVKCDEVAVDGV